MISESGTPVPCTGRRRVATFVGNTAVCWAFAPGWRSVAAVGGFGNGLHGSAGQSLCVHYWPDVLWKTNKHLPYVSSPLCHLGRIYAMKNGGLISCYEATTGRILY